MLNHVWFFVIPWTVACQAPLSMKFSRQEYWSGLPFPFPEYLLLDLPHCRQILYHLSHQGSPKLTWILAFFSLSLMGKHIWKKIKKKKKEKNLKSSPLLNQLDSVATTTKNYFLTHFYNFCQICHRVTLSSTFVCKIPWTEEPGGLQSMGSLGVGHDWATSLSFHFHALEKEMATHSSVPAWRIPGTGKPGGLPSMGSHRVGHDWSDLAAAAGTGFYLLGTRLLLH